MYIFSEQHMQQKRGEETSAHVHQEQLELRPVAHVQPLSNWRRYLIWYTEREITQALQVSLKATIKTPKLNFHTKHIRNSIFCNTLVTAFCDRIVKVQMNSTALPDQILFPAIPLSLCFSHSSKGGNVFVSNRAGWVPSPPDTVGRASR